MLRKSSPFLILIFNNSVTFFSGHHPAVWRRYYSHVGTVNELHINNTTNLLLFLLLLLFTPQQGFSDDGAAAGCVQQSLQR
jgi:hypothetical protein